MELITLELIALTLILRLSPVWSLVRRRVTFNLLFIFVAICIIGINMCIPLFPSDAAKFLPSMNTTMGLRTELHFHKAIEFLTAETDVS